MVKDLIEFIDNSPTAYGAIESIKNILIKEAYQPLTDAKIEKGNKYFVTRNDSSIIAFNVGKKLKDPALHICASHTDCPTLKLKPNPIIESKYGSKLNVEQYGGMLTRPWFDRPLSLAGRVIINDKDNLVSKVYIDKDPFCIIPSMAPHLNHDLQNNKVDVAVDLLPIVSLQDKYDFYNYLAKKLKIKKEDIMGFDLFLYPLEKGYIWGSKKEFFTVGHIDNLECAYTTLMGFVNNFNDNNINLYASFDNEEVGSLTRQGADSDFLYQILQRICDDLSLDYQNLLDHGMMLSCDNAHGVHPNHPELYDLNNAPVLNGGVVIKYNARQSYCTDSLSAALLKTIFKTNKIPYQEYSNKTGIKGGGTLGNLSNRHVSIVSADIGLAQWAMHSPVETAGVKDVDYMIKTIKQFYKRHLTIKDNKYQI